MTSKIALLAITVAAILGYGAGAFAQGPAGNADGAATISGSELRAGESRRPNTNEGVTTGSSTLRSIDRDTGVTPNGTRVDTSIAPGGLVGRDAPDAMQAAPAGR